MLLWLLLVRVMVGICRWVFVSLVFCCMFLFNVW